MGYKISKCQQKQHLSVNSIHRTLISTVIEQELILERQGWKLEMAPQSAELMLEMQEQPAELMLEIAPQSAELMLKMQEQSTEEMLEMAPQSAELMLEMQEHLELKVPTAC